MMLRNFWYGVEHSAAVTLSKPVAVQLMGQELVLYRGEQGQVFALERRCAHRQAALDQGWVEGNCIRCPYHGWRYEADGSCSDVPANQPGVVIPKRARVESYPVQEKYGLIWVFWGDRDPQTCPPLPELPEYDQTGWRTIWGDYLWQGHFTRVLANTIDMSHAPFVHSKGFGNKKAPSIRTYTLEREGEWSASGTIQFKTKPAYSLKLILRDKAPSGSFQGRFYMPNITRVDLRFSWFHFVLFMAHVPISDTQTLTKWLHIRNFVRTPLADFLMRGDIAKTFDQDNWAVGTQPAGPWPNLVDEVHVPSDALELAYRKCYERALRTGSELEEQPGSEIEEPIQAPELVLVE